MLLLLVELDDVPLCEPPVVEELGHVVPDGVGQDDDALLAGLQLLRCPHRRVDGGAAASSWNSLKLGAGILEFLLEFLLKWGKGNHLAYV